MPKNTYSKIATIAKFIYWIYFSDSDYYYSIANYSCVKISEMFTKFSKFIYSFSFPPSQFYINYVCLN